MNKFKILSVTTVLALGAVTSSFATEAIKPITIAKSTQAESFGVGGLGAAGTVALIGGVVLTAIVITRGSTTTTTTTTTTTN